jgi:threonine aldolase
MKYSVRNKISIHHGASMVIGRRGLFNKSTIVKVVNNKKIVKKHQYKEKRISDKNRDMNILGLSARNNLKWDVYWKELRDNNSKKLSQKIVLKGKQNEIESNMNSNSVASKSTSPWINKQPVVNVSDATLV